MLLLINLQSNKSKIILLNEIRHEYVHVVWDVFLRESAIMAKKNCFNTGINILSSPLNMYVCTFMYEWCNNNIYVWTYFCIVLLRIFLKIRYW